MSILAGIPEGKLTLEEETQLVVAGDEDSKERLVLMNIRESFYYAKGAYQSRGLDDGEILSVCYAALLSASKHFKSGQLRFFAFAKQHIRGGLSKAKRAQMVVRKAQEIEPLPETEEEDEEGAVNPETTTVRVHSNCDLPCSMPEFGAINLREDWAAMAPLLRACLTDRQRMVIELNFIGGLNLREIAGMIGYSRAYVHLVKQVALKKIRHRLVEQKKFYNR